MKIVIFGATGSVGQTIAKAAIGDKHDVTLLVRNKKKLEELLSAEILSQCRVCDQEYGSLWHLLIIGNHVPCEVTR